MAAAGWRLAHLAIMAATYGLVRYGDQSQFLTRAGYLGCFFILYSIAFVAWVVHSRFLGPFWFSPLAKLPQPKVGNLPVAITMA